MRYDHLVVPGSGFASAVIRHMDDPA